MARPEDLPNFTDPPIDEVALGLRFDPLDGYADVHAGLLWQRVRGDYPRSESHPRRDSAVEDLTETGGLRVPGQPTLELFDIRDSRGNRAWLISEDDSTLLQVQDTQFLRNWRRREDNYPSLDVHIEQFWHAYDAFCSMLSEERIPDPQIRQLELTYFNWITPREPSTFVPMVAAAVSTPHLGPAAEDVSMTVTYLDHDDAGSPIARLRIELQPAFKRDDDDAIHGYRFTLSYRAPLQDPTRDDVQTAIDRGRRVIDFTFCDLTSQQAHERWGRIK